MAVDRVLAILAPFWHRALNKAVVARRIGIFISIAALPHALFTTPITGWRATTNTCSFQESILAFYLSIYMLVVMSLIPMAVTILSNVIFAWALKKRPMRGPANNTRTDTGRVRERERRTNDSNYIIIIAATTCCFILLQFLTFGFEIESARRVASGLEDGSDQFFLTLSRLPIVLNSSMNVVFYSSSSMFRKALLSSLKKNFGTSD